MKTNQFKNNQEPKRQKLNPPKFEEQLIDFTVKGIALSQTVKLAKRRVWF